MDGCRAGDKHFATQYGVHEKTVARWRRELQRQGYVIKGHDGENRTLRPNHKIVGREQNCGQRTNSSPQKDGPDHKNVGRSGPQNRGTQRDIKPEGTRERAPAREEPGEEDNRTEEKDLIREGDPPGVRVWVQVTGERPTIQDRESLKGYMTEQADRWDPDVFRDVLREAYLNVGRDAHRIRIGYLTTAYERALSRGAGPAGDGRGGEEPEYDLDLLPTPDEIDAGVRPN